MAYPFEAAQAGYRNLWNKAAVKPGTDDHNADLFAGKIIAGEGQYRQVQAATGVPWFFVGALHMREGSCDFDRALCNGEKIIGTGKLTTLVPAGRGPYASWFDSGIDAMKLKDLQRVQDWSIERMLYSAEVYNGLGYLGKVNSPYVWAGTTNEQSGKYVADHVFDPNAEDAQLGVAAVLKRLAEKRPDIAAAIRSEGGAQLPPAPTPGPPTQEVLSPLPKIDIAGMIERAVEQAVVQALTARLQGTTGAQPGQGIDLAGLIAQLTGGPAPQPVIPPPATPPPEPTPKPGSSPFTHLFNILLGSGTAAAMSAGTLGTPFGMGQDPTTSGSMMTIASIASIAVSLIPGGYGAIASAGLGLLKRGAKRLAG